MQQTAMAGGRSGHLAALFVLVGIGLFINLFSATDYSVSSLLLNIEVKTAYPPQTRIILPPVGEIRANTHWLPWRLSVTLKNVDLALLRRVVFSAPHAREALVGDIQGSMHRLLLYFTLKLMGLGAAGAAFALWFLGIRSPRSFLWGAAAALIVVLIMAAGTYLTYDLNAFERLEYEGIIEAAPWVLNTAWEAFDRVEELGERIQVLAGNLYSALNRLETLGPIGLVESDLVVLHVSDIHNNPVAYDFAKQVIESFPVDFVMDTGDLTDWGTALEAEITRRIGELAVPYLFTSGNHDSPEVIQRLNKSPTVIIIDNEEKDLLGLRIAGMGDLVADRFAPKPAPLDELKAVAEQINREWSQKETRPDIFMIHNHRIARAIEPGLFPTVVYGHTHVLEIEEINGTVYINAGTTGAAGIRGFQSKEPLPYSLALLYFVFDEAGRPALTAVDGVHVAGLGQSFSLERTFVGSSRNLKRGVETSE